MKKTLSVISLVLVLSILLPIPTSAASPDTVNAAAEAREARIMKLFDERQAILMESPVDMVKLNDLDLELHDLGVEFHDQDEVAEIFPDAASAVNELSNSTSTENDSSVSTLTFELPENSPNNSWASYTTSDYLYWEDSKRYNIQRVLVQPITENSALWTEGEKSIDYETDWIAGTTDFFSVVAEVGLSYSQWLPEKVELAFTVLDIFSSSLEALQYASKIRCSDVFYRWETSTTALFTYVRLESEPEDEANLVYLSTKCKTYVAYLADIDSWSVTGDGTFVAAPLIDTEGKLITTTPENFYSIKHACWAKNNWQGGPVREQISYITISGPESKVVVNILLPAPAGPAGLEY